MIKLIVGIFTLLLLASLVFAVFWIFPKKLKLMRRLGPETTNADLINYAKNGDEEAQKLVRLSRFNYWVLILSGVSLTLLNHFLKR